MSEWLDEHGEPSYRVEQIVNGVYRQRVDGWKAMTTLSELFATSWGSVRFPSIVLEELRESADGTRKYLWTLVDGERWNR